MADPFAIGRLRKAIKRRRQWRKAMLTPILDCCAFYQALLASEKYADARRLTRHGFKAYSQGDEDGILQEIFARIGTGPRRFVELGCGNGLENNTIYLLVQGWRGLWLEGGAKNTDFIAAKFAPVIESGRLTVKRIFITRDNVDAAISEAMPEADIDLLSIDLDGNDYHVLKAIACVTPRVIVAEYNAKFRPPVEWIMTYNEAHRWDGTDYYGASLKAFEVMLKQRGYALVGCGILGTNAFFVRADLVDEDAFCAPFTAEHHYEPARHFLQPAFYAGHPANFGPAEDPGPEDPGPEDPGPSEPARRPPGS